MKILNSIDKEYYNQVTNSGVICPKCKKPIGYIEYVKTFKVKNYLAPEGFEGW